MQNAAIEIYEHWREYIGEEDMEIVGDLNFRVLRREISAVGYLKETTVRI